MFQTRRGFTLIELLVVTSIIMILAGTMTVAIFKVRTIMQSKAAKVDIRTMTMALAAYQRELGRYPPDSITGDVLWSVDADFSNENDARASNEALIYYLGRKHVKGANVYGPYMEFKQSRLVNRNAGTETGTEYPEYLDPFGRYYLYAENKSVQNPDGTGKGRNKGSYDIVCAGRDGQLGGTMSATEGYVTADVEQEKDNISNWSK
ncbi:MAG: prepilin-type N-terminal cleavage/methylation domain-containing protein [Planctomycetota bacterium]|jgi:prepilin-type N-terminal cleavage/methylation domain-containing protein